MRVLRIGCSLPGTQWAPNINIVITYVMWCVLITHHIANSTLNRCLKIGKIIYQPTLQGFNSSTIKKVIMNTHFFFIFFYQFSFLSLTKACEYQEVRNRNHFHFFILYPSKWAWYAALLKIKVQNKDYPTTNSVDFYCSFNFNNISKK